MHVEYCTAAVVLSCSKLKSRICDLVISFLEEAASYDSAGLKLCILL